jgi:hypothetical protein
MKFDIKKPCQNCPFRLDQPVPLRAGRAREIGNMLTHDDMSWFPCHETTGVKKHRRVKRENQSHCAGAMIMLWRMRMPNVAMRLALAFGKISVQNLDCTIPVASSCDEFINHHAKSSTYEK